MHAAAYNTFNVQRHLISRRTPPGRRLWPIGTLRPRRREDRPKPRASARWPSSRDNARRSPEDPGRQRRPLASRSRPAKGHRVELLRDHATHLPGISDRVPENLSTGGALGKLPRDLTEPV
jgi:hypothetical protein